MSDHSSLVVNIAATAQVVGAILGILGMLLFGFDHNNEYVIYILPCALFLLGLSCVLLF